MSGPAFGLICCGRPVQTNYETIDDARIVFTITDVNNVKHAVIFLTGAIQLPPGFAAAVYFLWLSEEGQINSKYLGFLSNEKPSALYRLSRFRHATASAGQDAFIAGLPSPISSSAQIGISLEPLETISSYVADPVQSADHHSEFSQYAAENLYNYISSFAKPLSAVCPGVLSSDVVVPVAAVVQWYQKISERLKADPSFWKS